MIQFYLFDKSNYETPHEADTAGALYALMSLESFDEPSGESELENYVAGAESAAECLGSPALGLCYKIQNGDDESEAKLVENITSLFHG